MNQDPKPTTPPLRGALAAALVAALKNGANTKPVEQAKPTSPKSNKG
jgi:hypothetical protein